MITISIEDFVSLMKDRNLLDALYEAGVDNWEGYDGALELFVESSNSYLEGVENSEKDS